MKKFHSARSKWKVSVRKFRSVQFWFGSGRVGAQPMSSGVEGLLKDCHRVNQLLRGHIEIHDDKVLSRNIPERLVDALKDALGTTQRCSVLLEEYHKRLLDNKLTVMLNRKIGAWIDEKEEQAKIAQFEGEGKHEIEHYRREIHGVQGLNLRTLGFLYWFLNQRLELFLQILQVSPKDFEGAVRWNRKRWRERDLAILEVETFKLYFLVKYMRNAADWPVDEHLTSRHKRLQCEEIVRCQTDALSRKLKKQENGFYSMLAVANGFSEHGWKYTSNLYSGAMMGIGAVYYGLRAKKAKERFNFLGTGRKDEDYLEGKERKEGADDAKFVKFLLFLVLYLYRCVFFLQAHRWRTKIG
jgi:hypothetical protein